MQNILVTPFIFCYTVSVNKNQYMINNIT